MALTLRPLRSELDSIARYQKMTGIKTSSKALFAAVDEAIALREVLESVRNRNDELYEELQSYKRLLASLESSIAPALEKIRQQE